MPSLIKTPAGTFAVKFRVNGKQIKRTFKFKKDAQQFIATITLKPEAKQSRILVSGLFRTYLKEVTPKHRGAHNEACRIERILRSAAWTQKTVDKLRPSDIQAYLDSRLSGKGRALGTTVGAATILREVKTIRAVWHWAMRKGFVSHNPTIALALPKEPEHRERIADKEDIDRLLIACAWDGKTVPADLKQLVVCAFLFACETGMRAGEILQIEAGWIDGRIIHLPAEATKTCLKRDVALSKEAVRLLELANNHDARFPYFSRFSNATRDAHFRIVRERAGLGAEKDSQGRVVKEGLNFHDSRATFATRAAKKMDVLSLARLTGHRDLKMLQRYYREPVEELAKKLD